MRKLICVVLVLASVCFMSVSQAESIEFDQYDDATLMNCLERIYTLFQERNVQKSCRVAQGTYLAGKDFPVGGYDITYPDDMDYNYLSIEAWSVKAMDNYLETHFYQGPDLVSKSLEKGETLHVSLNDGDKLVVNGGDVILTIANIVMFK